MIPVCKLYISNILISTIYCFDLFVPSNAPALFTTFFPHVYWKLKPLSRTENKHKDDRKVKKRKTEFPLWYITIKHVKSVIQSETTTVQDWLVNSVRLEGRPEQMTAEQKMQIIVWQSSSKLNQLKDSMCCMKSDLLTPWLPNMTWTALNPEAEPHVLPERLPRVFIPRAYPFHYEESGHVGSFYKAPLYTPLTICAY